MSIVLHDSGGIPQNYLKKTPGVSLGRKTEAATLGKVPGYGGLLRETTERIARREQPTGYERFMDRFFPSKAPEGKRALPFMGRAIGDVGDAVAGLAGSVAPLSKLIGQEYAGIVTEPRKIADLRKSGNIEESLEQRKREDVLGNLPKEVALELGTTLRHFPRSFKARPVSTALDALLMAKGVTGAIKGAKGLGSAVRKIVPKKDMYIVGKQAQGQLNKVKSLYGEKLGAEKNLIREMKGNIDTTPIVKDTLNSVKKAGIDTFNSTDLKNLNQTLNKLGLKGSVRNADDLNKAISTFKNSSATPATVLETRDMINNRFLTQPKPGVVISSKSTGFGEKLLKDVRDSAKKSIVSHDKLAGGTGKWEALNKKYADVSKVYDEIAPKIGNDLKLEKSMGTIGDRILEGNQGYINLWKKVDKITKRNTLRDIEQIGLKSRMVREGGQSLVGQQLRPLISAGRLAGSKIGTPIRGALSMAEQMPLKPTLGAAGIRSFQSLNNILYKNIKKQEEAR